MPRTIKSIFTPACEASIKRLDDFAVHQRIHLGDDARGQSLVGVVGFALDQLQHPLVQFERRDEQFAHALELADAGEQIEEIRGILAELRSAGEQPDVGVKPGGGGIVIAGAEMNVAADVMLFAPHDEADLGVNFVADQAVNDVHAGFLELPRPLDVVGFIEARAQFHHGGDLLAVLHRVHRARRRCADRRRCDKAFA